MSDEILLTNLILDSSFSDYVVFMGTAEEPKKHGIVDAVSFERCSDRGENQRHSCSVLSTFASSARVWGRTSRHLDSDETVLGRGTVWETFVQRHRQISQDYQ